MNRDLLALLASVALPLGVVGLVYRAVRGPLTHHGVQATPDRPRSFGYKSSWLAVQSASTEEIARALAPKRATPCNWASGFERVFGWPLSKQVFVTPPVEGWVFVLGSELEGEPALDRIAALSATLGRPVYAFASHRVVSLAVWIRAENGRITRAWSVADGTRGFDRGEPTAEERALDISFEEDPQEEDDERWSRQSDEATVIALASAWTRDPTTLADCAQLGVGLLLTR